MVRSDRNPGRPMPRPESCPGDRPAGHDTPRNSNRYREVEQLLAHRPDHLSGRSSEAVRLPDAGSRYRPFLLEVTRFRAESCLPDSTISLQPTLLSIARCSLPLRRGPRLLVQLRGHVKGGRSLNSASPQSCSNSLLPRPNWTSTVALVYMGPLHGLPSRWSQGGIRPGLRGHV